MEPAELLTKRRIEKLASQYEGYDSFVSHEREPGQGYDVFVSHSSRDVEFIRKVLLFLYHSKGGVQGYVDWHDPDMQYETEARQ